MSEITELLQEAGAGRRDAIDEVFQRLHGELKRVARNRLGWDRSATVTPTVLVNELYLKFCRSQALDLKSRRHFFACAAQAMQQILVDAARSAQAEKRGGDALLVTLTDAGETETDADVLHLHDALSRLERIHPELAELVRLRFFAGLTASEVAALRGQSTRTVERDWVRARAFLKIEMDGH